MMTFIGKRLKFAFRGNSSKYAWFANERKWVVTGRHGEGLIGIIEWCRTQNCYAFHPGPQSTFDADVLTEIAIICAEETRRAEGHMPFEEAPTEVVK
jgi:hypothetical protein